MVVLGKNAFIFESTSRICSVKPFSSELGLTENLPIVDGAIAYDCQYIHRTYILIIRNAIYIPTMHHNTIPPFLIIVVGLIMKNISKIHCKDPTPSDYCISFKAMI